MKGLQTSIHTFPCVTLSKMTFISVHTSSLKSVFPNRFIDLPSCDSSTVTEAYLNVQMLMYWWPGGFALSPQSNSVEGLNSCSSMCSLVMTRS